jgi:hypothetical protein
MHVSLFVLLVQLALAEWGGSPDERDFGVGDPGAGFILVQRSLLSSALGADTPAVPRVSRPIIQARSASG